MGHNNPISSYCHPKVEMRGKVHADEEHRVLCVLYVWVP